MWVLMGAAHRGPDGHQCSPCEGTFLKHESGPSVFPSDGSEASAAHVGLPSTLQRASRVS